MAKPPVIPVTLAMLDAGVEAYDKWLAREDEIHHRARLGTLADEMYLAMERARIEHESVPENVRFRLEDE
jgi:hypothetical protein